MALFLFIRVCKRAVSNAYFRCFNDLWRLWTESGSWFLVRPNRLAERRFSVSKQHLPARYDSKVQQWKFKIGNSYTLHVAHLISLGLIWIIGRSKWSICFKPLPSKERCRSNFAVVLNFTKRLSLRPANYEPILQQIIWFDYPYNAKYSARYAGSVGRVAQSV